MATMEDQKGEEKLANIKNSIYFGPQTIHKGAKSLNTPLELNTYQECWNSAAKESSTHHHTGYESILKHRRLSSSLTASISSLRYRADPLSESTAPRFPITVYRFPFGNFHCPDSDGPLDLRS
ncbi:hypothetical protein ACLKA7_005912 [Drosophila subpalustris]